jgi:hypothetical protein
MGYRIRSLAVVSWQGREELADGRNRWLSKGHGKPVRVLICKLCDLFANFQTRRLWLPVPCVSRHLGIKHHLACYALRLDPLARPTLRPRCRRSRRKGPRQQQVQLSLEGLFLEQLPRPVSSFPRKRVLIRCSRRELSVVSCQLNEIAAKERRDRKVGGCLVLCAWCLVLGCLVARG